MDADEYTESNSRITTTMYIASRLMLSVLAVTAFDNAVLSAPVDGADQDAGNANMEAKFPYDWSTPGNARFLVETPTQAAEANPTGHAAGVAKFPYDWSTPGNARFLVETPTQVAETEPTGQVKREGKFLNDWSTPGDARFFVETPTQAA